MTTADILLIIAAVFLGIQNAITAWKVQAIQHSVNSAASAQVAKIDAKDAIIVALTKNLTDAQETAKLLAQNAGPVKGT